MAKARTVNRKETKPVGPGGSDLDLKSIVIKYGALVPTLPNQFAEQGFDRISSNHISTFQMDADSIVHLQVRGLLNDAEVKNARTKLTKNIMEYLGKNL